MYSTSRDTYGLLVRGWDKLDGTADETETLWTPASILHASIQPPNGMYPKTSQGRDFLFKSANVGVLVANRWKRSFRAEADFVHVTSLYPTDAASDLRGALNDSQGIGCEPGVRRVCVHDVCWADNCTCNLGAVPASRFGSHLRDYLQINHKKKMWRAPWLEICSLPSSQIPEMIQATNSLWRERLGWRKCCYGIKDKFYSGWNEVMVSNNVRSLTMADSLVIRLPAGFYSACQLTNQRRRGLAEMLTRLHSTDPQQKKPIVFYRELHGMKNQTECDIYWDGVDCEAGYRKDFVSQTLEFEDGACVGIPVDCQDSYFVSAVQVRESGRSCQEILNDQGCAILSLPSAKLSHVTLQEAFPLKYVGGSEYSYIFLLLGLFRIMFFIPRACKKKKKK